MAKKVKPAKNDNLFLTFIFVSLLVSAFNIIFFINTRMASRVLGAQTENVEEEPNPLIAEKAFWSDIVEKNPTYRDGYIELSDIEMKLGNRKRSEELLRLARGVDPNYQKF
jgi:hypothetical protein